MKKIFALAAAALVFGGMTSSAMASDWDLDTSHSTIGFSIRHMMVSNTKGQFGKFTGTLSLDEKDITHSSVNVTIESASIDTRDAKRDEHLKSPDFFDVATFPQLTFKSTKVEKAGKKLKVTGDLTLHGVTKSVVLTVEGPTTEIKDPWGNTKRGVVASTTINRKDFGLSWNKALDAGGLAVGDEVTISIEAELNKKS